MDYCWFDIQCCCLFGGSEMISSFAKVVPKDEVVEAIKHMSWQWFLARKKGPLCLFYDWFLNPLDCMCN